MQRPKIWYPAGAGGHWLNYLIWCHRHQTTVPGIPVNFDWRTLHGRQMEGGESYLGFMIHDTDPADSQICLGSHRAWFNFFLCINTKKLMASKEGRYKAACNALNYCKQNITFNLDWCLIWTNPAQFIQDLNSTGGFDITVNEHTTRAFEQYRVSCYMPNIDSSEFRQSDLCRDWYQAILDSEPDRAEEIFKNMYFSDCKI
jgi:hypothetical protein